MNFIAKVCLIIIVSITFFYLSIFLISKTGQSESKVLVFSIALAVSAGVSFLSLKIWQHYLSPDARSIALIMWCLLLTAVSIIYYFLNAIHAI